MHRDIDTKALVRDYEDNGLTVKQMAEKHGILYRTMYRYLERAGANMRRRTDAKAAELEDRDWLYAKYVGEGLSSTEIGKSLGVSNKAVSWWLKRHEIPARPRGAHVGHKHCSSEESRKKRSEMRRGKYTGPEHWNWKGGIVRYDRTRNQAKSLDWVRAVKDRDGWKCTECGSEEQLEAHHIKPWKRYPELRYELSNGATLCHSCHVKAHKFKFGYLPDEKAKKATSAPDQVLVKI